MSYSKKSFSLLGVLISAQILIVAIVAIVGLMSSIVINSKTAGNRLIAVELAQEGIEAVRNTRDKNWMAGGSSAWRDGLADGSYQAKLNPLSLLASTEENKKIKYNSTFWYVPSEEGVIGADTIFERIVTLSSDGADKMIVECEVAWKERGKNYNVKLDDWLYNWR